MMNLRYFPTALYFRLFGAVLVGYFGGNAGNSQNIKATLLFAVLGIILSIAGYWMMRPLMKESRRQIKLVNQIPVHQEQKK